MILLLFLVAISLFRGVCRLLLVSCV